jgi:hypothetical protein
MHGNRIYPANGSRIDIENPAISVNFGPKELLRTKETPSPPSPLAFDWSELALVAWRTETYPFCTSRPALTCLCHFFHIQILGENSIRYKHIL